jgi:hypothetical protein
MKNLTELTNQEIDQMVEANKKQVLEASRTYKNSFAQTSANTVEFMNRPAPEFKSETIECDGMDLLLFTNYDGSRFFYIVKDGVEYYVNPTTLKLEEVGQN